MLSPEPQREKNENQLDASPPCHSEKKQGAEIRSLLANEVKTDALLELLCGKGQSKRLQSVTGREKKRFSILAEKKKKMSAAKHSYSNLEGSK